VCAARSAQAAPQPSGTVLSECPSQRAGQAARAQRPQVAMRAPAAQTALWPLFGRGGLNRPSSPPFGPCALGPIVTRERQCLRQARRGTPARCRLSRLLQARSRCAQLPHPCPGPR